MNQVKRDRELFRILQQLNLLDSDGRAIPDSIEKIHKLAQGRPALHKTRLATDALALVDSSKNPGES